MHRMVYRGEIGQCRSSAEAADICHFPFSHRRVFPHYGNETRGSTSSADVTQALHNVDPRNVIGRDQCAYEAHTRAKPHAGKSVWIHCLCIPTNNGACEVWASATSSPNVASDPSIPPNSEMTTPSPTNIPRIVSLLKPRAFRGATSRVRSRVDIAMVLPETSKVVKTTAREI
jgi:hypothetical protein